MKKLKPILILLFVLFTSLNAIGQSLTYTFIDPCTKDITYFSIPIQSGGGTTIFFLGQQRYFTAGDVASGVFASWVNQTYSNYRKISPCGVQQARVTQNQITSQIIGSTIQNVVGSIMSQAKSESNSSTNGSLVSEGNNNSKDNKKSKNGKNNTNSGSNTTSNNSSSNGSNNTGGENQTNSNSNSTTSSSSNTTNSGSSSGGNGSNNSGSSQNGGGSGSSSTQGNGSGSSSTQGNGQGNSKTGEGSNSSTTQTGGQAGGQAGGQGSGNNTTKTEGSEVVGAVTMTTDANNDRGNGKSRNNPIIISSDLTNAQNLDRTYTGIINVGMSQSSMTGTSSWGINSMIWFNFNQFALTGRYTKIQYSKTRKIKLIHNMNLTGVYSYGNILGFLGYSAILNAGKWGITGINVSAAATKTPDDDNLFMSPSATAFYTKPFKAGKRMILSPELYIISTPLIYSSVDKVSVSDRTFSAFIGTGVDYQISKRFKVNMNYKLNMSTNPDFPILSFFLIGSKVNL
jgi:hypothetical protein